ncbi:MAG: hypothetical protein ACI30H_09310 [Paludibacteraceae bacterium]
MKYCNVILCVGVAVVMSACAARKAVVQPEVPMVPAVDTTRVPLFNPEALYVITREYELHAPSEQTLAEYMDERLMQLYPHEAYRGVSAKLFGVQSQFDLSLRPLLPTAKEVVAVQPVDTLYAFVSLADESAFLDLSPADVRLDRV